MRRIRHNAIALSLILPLVVAASGCATTPKFESVDGLAKALKSRGVAYDKTDVVNFSDMPAGRIDEGLGLTGDKLQVLILRITDDRTYKIASGSAFILAIVKDTVKDTATSANAVPPDIYLSKPFIVVIRTEPQQGQVRAVLKKLLREDEKK